MYSLTHDTKKAALQTMKGLRSLCDFLYSVGFEYVVLGSIQSDRIEGEFSVYRQSTGSNHFMMASDVLVCFKKRLTNFAATFLQHVETRVQASFKHDCAETTYDEAHAV